MTSLNRHQLTDLKNRIKEQMFNLDIPGLAAGVWIDDKTVFEEAFGFSDVKNMRLLKTRDIFHMASISKLFTATAVMQLHEKGLLNTGHKVMDYLPGFQPSEKTFRKVTIKQMLSHTSGLPDCEDYDWDHARFDDQALGDYVKAQENLRFIHQPGETFLYSNIVYEILGHVVQVVSGMSFEAYCTQHIFNPAGMKHSDFLKANVPENLLVKPHVKDENKKVINSDVFPYNRSHGPSSTLYATMEDLFIFSKVVLETLAGHRKDVLKQDTLHGMLQAQTSIKKDEAVGLGWFLSDYQEKRFIGHEGNDIGFRTTFALIPASKISIVVLANLQKASTRKLMRMLYDAFHIKTDFSD